MLLKRYIIAIGRKKCCKVYSLCVYVAMIFVVYVCWHMVQTWSAEEYILKGNRLFVLPPSDVRSVSSDVHVLSAYYDDREIDNSGIVIRILALTTLRKAALHCCIQTLSTRAWICSTTAVQNKILARNNHGGTQKTTALFENMYTCRGFPGSLFREKPTNGILVDPTYGQYTKDSVVADFRITYVKQDITFNPVNRSFTVCIHPRNNNKPQARFSDKQDVVEFVLLTKILGSSHLVSYYPNALVNYLMNSSIGDRISLDTVTWKSPYGGQEKFKTLAMNDCVYRSLGRNEYVLFLDINEILVPVTSADWLTLVNSLYKIHNTKSVGAYNFQLFSFFDETTNRTASIAATSKNGNRNSNQVGLTKAHLPRSVRYRLRENVSTTEVVIAAQPEKVDHVTFAGSPKMLPGYSVINVPQEFGAVHRFVQGHRRLKDLIVDSSKDKVISSLLRALQLLGYDMVSH